MKVFAAKKKKNANILFLCFTVLGEAILTCCMLEGRVGKDTKRSLKGKSTELMIQNVWNGQTLCRKSSFTNFFSCSLNIPSG